MSAWRLLTLALLAAVVAEGVVLYRLTTQPITVVDGTRRAELTAGGLALFDGKSTAKVGANGLELADGTVKGSLTTVGLSFADERRNVNVLSLSTLGLHVLGDDGSTFGVTLTRGHFSMSLVTGENTAFSVNGSGTDAHLSVRAGQESAALELGAHSELRLDGKDGQASLRPAR